MRRQFIYHKDRTFMLVEPRPWMMRSSLITEALKSGGHLAVEMNTGYLTVVRNYEVKNVPSKSLELVNLDTKETYNLPMDYKVATLRIHDYISKDKYSQYVINYYENDEKVREQLIAIAAFNWYGIRGIEKTIMKLITGNLDEI
jgi:hypothetical protein